MRRWVGVGSLAGALTSVLLIAGCGSDTTRRTDEHYCATVNAHLAELNNPSVATPADVERTVDLYHSIAEVAPLAVEEEWNVLAIAYETASTVVPGDQASMQLAADTIRASQKSASAITSYTQQLCNAQVGPSIVPTTLLSGTTTTVEGEAAPDPTTTSSLPATAKPAEPTSTSAP